MGDVVLKLPSNLTDRKNSMLLSTSKRFSPTLATSVIVMACAVQPPTDTTESRSPNPAANATATDTATQTAASPGDSTVTASRTSTTSSTAKTPANSNASGGTPTATAGAKSTSGATTPAPTVAFVAPTSTDESPVGGSYTVKLSFSNAPSGATFDLYQTTTVGATSGGIAVTTGAPVTTTQVTVNTSTLANASYGYYAILRAGSTTTTFPASGSVRVVNNGAPTVALTGVYKSGATSKTLPATITFTASDPDGDPITIKIEYSADSGSTWAVLTSNLAYSSGQGYVWDTAGHLPTEGEGIRYRLRVTASDNHSGSGIDTTTADFGITTTNYTFAGNVSSLLSSPCAGCHDPAGGNSSLYIWSDCNNGSGTGSCDKSSRVVTRVRAGTMPPGGPLSATTQMKLQLWQWQGAPH